MSQSGILTISSSGGGTPITTINGDTGSATGATILLYANNASNGAGSSVKFTNSGSVSLFNVTDSAGNTIIGNNAGNLTNLGGSNTILGAFAGSSLAGNGLSSIATSNVILGYNAANKLTTGFQNNIQGTNAMLNATSANTTVAIGFGTLTQILTGVSNVVIGTNCGTNYTSSESSNILLGTSVLGITGESNSIRIGNNGNGTNQQNKCFIAGIKSVTVTNQQTVTIDSSTGQH